jgi:hypothetical protein
VERTGKIAPRLAIEIGFLHAVIPPGEESYCGMAARDKRASGAPSSGPLA